MIDEAPITSAMARIAAMAARHRQIARPVPSGWRYEIPAANIPTGRQRTCVLMRRDRATYAAIAQRLGISTTEAWRICRRWSVPRAYGRIDRGAIARLKREGQSLASSARQLGITREWASKLYHRAA